MYISTKELRSEMSKVFDVRLNIQNKKMFYDVIKNEIIFHTMRNFIKKMMG
jgi:hypothetical protein